MHEAPGTQHPVIPVLGFEIVKSVNVLLTADSSTLNAKYTAPAPEAKSAPVAAPAVDARGPAPRPVVKPTPTRGAGKKAPTRPAPSKRAPIKKDPEKPPPEEGAPAPTLDPGHQNLTPYPA